MTFEEQFQEAGRDGKRFRGAPFWSWNDDLDPQELRRQVRSMCESGMGGFFMHARDGLITPYLSQEYIDCHRACIEEAKSLGMEAWLYDEDCWPSGSGGGVTPAKGPFSQAKRLVMERVRGGDGEASETTIAVYRCSAEGDSIASFERVPDSALAEECGADLLHCYYAAVGYIDVMSEDAVAQFIDNTHEALAKAFEPELGKSVPGIFTDEPNYSHNASAQRAPWTLDFADEFQARTGYDIRDRLVQVFYPLGSDYRRTRRDFWRVVTELFVEAFSRQIYEWCERHKLQLTGHYLWEDNLEVQVRHIGAAMPHYEYEQAPGIDHLCLCIADPILPKQVSSVAHQFGGRRVLSETFGCCGWNMTFEDQKWIAEWQYALGVNLMCQHLCLYSLRGWRKRDYPPSIYYQQPWWPHYRVVEDHFARLACALTSGRHVADVLLIHPIESAWAEFDPLERSPEVAKLNDDFSAVSRFLQEFKVDYDYGDESIMERHASVRDGQVRVRDAAYDIVVLPRLTTLRRSTVDLLRAWIGQGGKVIVCGAKPTMIDGVESAEVAEVLEGVPVVPVEFDAVKDAVLEMVEPRIQVLDQYGSDARTIYFHQRDLGGKQLFFVVNTDNTDVRCDSVIRFRGSGKVEEWDLDTGEIAEMTCSEVGGHTVVERAFAPTQSRLLSFDTTQRPKIGSLERWMAVDETEVTGPWKLSRKDPNSITLDYCRYKVGEAEFSELVPTIWLGARLSRIEEETPVTLRYEFFTDFADPGPRNFVLAMECPELYEIRVNGQRVSYVESGWWCDVSFKKVPIDLYVQPGANTIEVTCSYLGERGRRKRQEELHIPELRSRMWTDPPADVKDPIIIPYGGETADRIRDHNRLKMGLDLESVYVLGDFGVWQDQPGVFVLREEETETGAGDLVGKGCCFYRGTLVYEGAFDYENRDEDRLMLALDRLGGIVARVFVNGTEAGSIKWRPMEVEIGPLVRPGPNGLRIEITNSCRNLLGPHHHIDGELTNVRPRSFGAEAGYASLKDHGRGDGPDRALSGWTGDYSFVETGLVAVPRIVYVRRG